MNPVNEGYFWSLSPWGQMTTDNKKKWLFKFKQVEGSYQFLVTDMQLVYIEYVNAKDVAARNKEMNPRLETDINNILEHIESSINATKDNTKSVSAHATLNELRLTLENKFVGDLPFKWEFDMQNSKNVDTSIMKEFIISPLILTVQRLLFENSKLKDIISHKDKEIADYKEKGAKVSRKFLETVEFNDDNLQVELKESSAFARSICAKPFNIAVEKSFNDAISLAVQDSRSPVLHNLLTKAGPSPKKSPGRGSSKGSGSGSRVLQTLRVPRSRKRGGAVGRKRVDPSARGAKNLMDDSDTDGSGEEGEEEVSKKVSITPPKRSGGFVTAKSMKQRRRGSSSSRTTYVSDSDPTDFEDNNTTTTPDSSGKKGLSQQSNNSSNSSQKKLNANKKNATSSAKRRGRTLFDSGSDASDNEDPTATTPVPSATNEPPPAPSASSPTNPSVNRNIVTIPARKARGRGGKAKGGGKAAAKRPVARRRKTAAAGKPPGKRGVNMESDDSLPDIGKYLIYLFCNSIKAGICPFFFLEK